MDFKVMKAAVTSKVGRQILLGRKHSPTVLFAGGVVGVVATTVLASRATLKLDDVLDKHDEKRQIAKTLQHKDYSETDRKRDLLYIKINTGMDIAKLYAPAVVVGMASVGALTGSHVILTKRNAAVTAAYAVLEKGFNEYRERVRTELGDDKDREFRHGVESREIVTETDKGPKVSEIKQPRGASIYARFFDESSPNWSKTPGYNQLFIQCQQNYANDLLRARGHVFLNEVYDMLGLERSKEGAVVGWVLGNGDNFIDFGVFENDAWSGTRFVNGNEKSIHLDFNVDGLIYDKI